MGKKKTYRSGGISTTGYKENSPHKNRDFNIIPSGNITMKNVKHPVVGIDNTGVQQIMYPGYNYTFPGQQVLEIPVPWTRKYQKGGKVDNTGRKKPLVQKQQFLTPEEEFQYNIALANQRNQAQIQQYQPQSTGSKAWEIATNPMTAAQFAINKQPIPDHFSQNTPRNPYDIASDIVNPFGIAESARQVPGNIADGNYGQAFLNTLSVLPAAKEVRNITKAKKIAQKAKEAIPYTGGFPTKTIQQTRGNTPAPYLNEVQQLSKEDEIYKSFGIEPKLKIGDFSNPKYTTQLEKYNEYMKEFVKSNSPQTKNIQALDVQNQLLQRLETAEGKRRLKQLGKTEDNIKKLKIIDDTDDVAYYNSSLDKPRVGINPGIPTNRIRPITRHELEHGVQEYTPTQIDKDLSLLELRKTPKTLRDKNDFSVENLDDKLSNRQDATDYFVHGSGGREKSAMLAELQQYMVDNKLVSHAYAADEITPNRIKEIFTDHQFDRKYPLRIFDIMKASDNNYKIIAESLNKMLSVTPVVGAGIIANENNKKQYGGFINWTDKYK